MSSEKRDEVLEKNVEGMLREAHDPPRLEPEARARILGRLKQRIGGGETSGKKHRRRMSRERYWALGVAAAAAIGLLWIAGRGPLGLGEAEPPRHENSDRAPRSVELDDGSALLLRQDARVAVLGARHLRLEEGEILLEVEPGRRPFVVEATGGRAVALGTRFLMRRRGEETLAAVVEGRVRLESGGGEATLGAGEQGVLAPEEAPTRRPAPRISYLASWAREARRGRETSRPGPARRGNLLARMPNWQERDYPLPLRELVVDVHVENQVARVAIDETFENPRPWQLEGVYWFPLPPDAAISRLAMYVDGKRMEAGIVERERGRAIYDSIVYRRRDPALLEWMAGNVFRVRIFPLPPRQEKRILLSYTQALPRLYDDVRLEVPIPAVDNTVDLVKFQVRVADCQKCEIHSPSHAVKVSGEGRDRLVTFEAKDHEVGDDLVLIIRHGSREPGVAVYDAGEERYFLVRAQPEIAGHGEEEGDEAVARRPRRWVILHDTSASRRDEEREAQVHFIDRFVGELGERDEVALLAFDATVRQMAEGFTPVAELDRPAAHRFLTAQAADGVGYTDLGQALERATELLAGAGDDLDPYILYVGDGVVTGGERDLDRLGALVSGSATAVCVAVGETRDRRVLRSLASATGGLFTSVSPSEDLDWRAFDLAAALHTPRVTSLEASLVSGGGREIEAETYLDSPQIAEGEEVTVIARGSGAPPKSLVLRGRVDGRSWRREIALDGVALETGAGYLPRLWAQRRIEALLEAGGEESQEEITALGLEHWLMTPFTSLLVLEDPKMYEEHGVERPGSSGWAAYPAPQEIEKLDEPPPPSDDLGVEAPSAILARAPAPLFSRSGVAGYASGFVTIGSGSFGTIGSGPAGSLIGRGGGGGGGVRSMLSSAARDGTAGALREERATTDATEAEPAESSGAEAEPDPDAPAGLVVPVSGAALPAEWKVKRSRPSSRFGLDVVGATASRGPAAARYRGLGGRVYPIALHYDGDPRLDDLTEHVPGLFTDGFDLEREALLRRADVARGAITSGARLLVERSRARMLGRRYEGLGGDSIALDGEGRFVIEGSGLPREQVIYDGSELYHVYPELELVIHRRVGPTEPALLERFAPFLLARPEHLARWYAVSKRGERTLVLALPTTGETAFEIDLDRDYRPIEIRRLEGADAGVWYRFTYGEGRVSIEGRGAGAELDVEEVTEEVPEDPGLGQTVVEMPLRRPAYWSETQPPAGAEAWRAQKRQLLASYAALGDVERMRAVVAELAEQVAALTAGELVLASRALPQLSQEAFDGAMSGIGGHPVARYLKAVRAAGTPALDQVAAAAGRTLVGELSSYRALLRALSRGSPRDAVLARQKRFADSYDDPRLRYVAAYLIHQRYRWKTPQEAALPWSRVADRGRWWALAQVEAARALHSAGDADGAAERYLQVYGKSQELGGFLPPLDTAARAAFFQSSRGQAGFRLFWSRWREQVLAAEDPELLFTFLVSARNLGSSDIERAAARAVALGLEDRQTVLRFAEALLGFGRAAQAWAILEPALERMRARGEADAELLERASVVAERQGRLAEAAELLGRSMTAARDVAAPLADLRREYQRLVRLHGQLALRASGAVRGERLARALEALASWRRVDPANPALDRQAASLLYSAGRPEDAWRYLTTAIERRPGEGSAYETVASALEAEGRLEQAEAMWAAAARLSPENPNWLLRRAQALFALDRAGDAGPILQEIVAGTWHERFAGVKARAKALLKEP